MGILRWISFCIGLVYVLLAAVTFVSKWAPAWVGWAFLFLAAVLVIREGSPIWKAIRHKYKRRVRLPRIRF